MSAKIEALLMSWKIVGEVMYDGYLYSIANIKVKQIITVTWMLACINADLTPGCPGLKYFSKSKAPAKIAVQPPATPAHRQ